MKKYVLLAAVLLLTIENFYSQNRREPVVFTILTGASLPLNDFGLIDSENSGFAGIGGGATLEFAALVYSPGIAWITSASYFYNPSKENDLGNSIIGEGREGFSSTAWNNINLLTGLKIYGPFFGPELIFTFEAGVNFAGPPEITLPQDFSNISISYESKTAFAYSIGAAFNFNGFLLGASYMNLGKPEIKIRSLTGNGGIIKSSEMPIRAAFIYIGFNL